MIWGVSSASPTNEPLRIVKASESGSVVITAADLESVRAKMSRSAGSVLRRREDVEDAVQEALLRILRSGTRVESGRGSLAALACTTVRRVALDMLARRGPLLSSEGAGDLLASAPANLGAEPLDAAHIKDRLRDAVDRLPDAQRAAFLLVHQEGLSHSEAARELRISQETLRARLFRARGQLREVLKDLRP
jgi:RNA polymerase sigma-70 factor (ECF subfamily)